LFDLWLKEPTRKVPEVLTIGKFVVSGGLTSPQSYEPNPAYSGYAAEIAGTSAIAIVPKPFKPVLLARLSGR
jgi:hypothetical protein